VGTPGTPGGVRMLPANYLSRRMRNPVIVPSTTNPMCSRDEKSSRQHNELPADPNGTPLQTERSRLPSRAALRPCVSSRVPRLCTPVRPMFSLRRSQSRRSAATEVRPRPSARLPTKDDTATYTAAPKIFPRPARTTAIFSGLHQRASDTPTHDEELHRRRHRSYRGLTDEGSATGIYP